MNFKLLIPLLFLLNLADALTTFIGLNCCQGLAELNPLFTWKALPLKLVLPLIYGSIWLYTYKYTVKHNFRKATSFLNLLLFALCLIYSGVVVWNLNLIANS